MNKTALFEFQYNLFEYASIYFPAVSLYTILKGQEQMKPVLERRNTKNEKENPFYIRDHMAR